MKPLRDRAHCYQLDSALLVEHYWLRRYLPHLRRPSLLAWVILGRR